jgi:hypothetical protein
MVIKKARILLYRLKICFRLEKIAIGGFALFLFSLFYRKVAVAPPFASLVIFLIGWVKFILVLFSLSCGID